MKLLLSQKNELFKIIEDSETLTAGQFRIIEPRNSSNGNISISLKNSDYSFKIFEDKEYVKSFFVNYEPGIDTYKEISGRIIWKDISKHFKQWIDNVSRELTEPNLWEKLEQEIATINYLPYFNNSKFSVREFDELKSKVEFLSQNLNSIPLLVEQQIEIKRELERVTELAKDLGKFDWRNLFIGTLISIVIQLSVTEENGAMLWRLIKSIFNTYFLK